MATAKVYTVSDLLVSVKARASIPTASGGLSDSDLLRFANEEMDENLGPLILSCREEFFLTFTDIDVVSGQTEYDIPYRSFGNRIRIIKPLLGDSITEGQPLSPIPLDLVYGTSNQNISNYNNRTSGFYVKNDKIVLTFLPTTVGLTALRVYFYMRPNDMVELSKGARVNSIDTGTNTIVVDSVPSAFKVTDQYSAAIQYDFLQALPNHKLKDYDKTIVSVNTVTKTIVFTDTLPTDLVVGDYVCIAGETVVPQIPVDVIPVLEQSVVCKVLEAIGDTEGLKNAYVRLQKIEGKLLDLIDSRIESPGKKLVNTNSFLRSRVRGSGGRF